VQRSRQAALRRSESGDDKCGCWLDFRATGVVGAQHGTILANELKNNSNKLARWTAEAILAGTDQMRFASVGCTAVTDVSLCGRMGLRPA